MPQQTGVLFIIRQQVQPQQAIEQRQSQQAWIISQHFGSPEVQVTQQPLSVISQVQTPMVRLQQQTAMPFIMQQTLQRPFWSIMQRFCIMPQATVSSHEHTIFMPPAHFSNFMVPRGTIKKFGPTGIVAGMPLADDMPGMCIVGIPIPVRSIIIVLVIS